MKWISYDPSETKLLQTVNDIDDPPFKLTFQYPCTSITTCHPAKISLIPGLYKFELWGAQGGIARNIDSTPGIEETGGRGAYVSGVILLKKSTKLFLYIGANGENQTSTQGGVVSYGGYNGGGNGGVDLYDSSDPESSAGGGGSTDIRLVEDTADQKESLQSRIIVAGAGGGGCSIFASSFRDDCGYTTEISEDTPFLCSKSSSQMTSCPYAGSAGALHGYTTSTIASPGTQTHGLFGKGQDGLSLAVPNIPYAGAGGSSGGCGSGYFGGTTATTYPDDDFTSTGGSGGSSYVSGCEGCKSVIKGSETHETSDNPIHYSGMYFTRIKMLSGIQQMISPFDTSEIGHSGSGAIAITYIFPYVCSYKGKNSYCLQLNFIAEFMFCK